MNILNFIGVQSNVYRNSVDSENMGRFRKLKVRGTKYLVENFSVNLFVIALTKELIRTLKGLEEDRKGFETK